MKTTTIVAIALGLLCAGPALAQTYRAIQGGATNVIYVVPESLKKDGSKAQANIVAILENPRPNGMIAQELTMAIDCGAKTFQQTQTVDLDAMRKELARRPASMAPQTAPKGSMGDILVNYACTGRFADDKVQVFKSFDEALAGTKAYLLANRTPPKK
jgi:hypothetical protein